MKSVRKRVATVSAVVCGLATGFVGCSTEGPAPTPPAPPSPTFSVQVNSANEFGFFSVFGTDTRDFQLSAQRSDSGSLASGGWSSSDTAKVQLTAGAAAGSAAGKAISAGDPTVTFQVDGVTGTTVVKSRPNLFRIRGTYQVTACTDTLSPAVSPSLCAGSIANSLAIGQTGDFFFDLATNLNNAQVSGRFYDTRIGGSIFHQINPPVTINSSGQVSFEGIVVTNVGIGSGVAAYNNVTVRQVWTVTAAKVDDVTGRATLTITINNRTGNVTVVREIRSVRDGR
jgi:hypothetical protein